MPQKGTRTRFFHSLCKNLLYKILYRLGFHKKRKIYRNMTNVLKKLKDFLQWISSAGEWNLILQMIGMLRLS